MGKQNKKDILTSLAPEINVKAKTLKLWDQNLRKYPHNLRVGKYFLKHKKCTDGRKKLRKK